VGLLVLLLVVSHDFFGMEGGGGVCRAL
jgi:hypothetical protein